MLLTCQSRDKLDERLVKSGAPFHHVQWIANLKLPLHSIVVSMDCNQTLSTAFEGEWLA